MPVSIAHSQASPHPMKDTFSTLLPAALTVLFAFGAGFYTAALSSVWWAWLALGLAVSLFGRTSPWRPFGALVPPVLWGPFWLTLVISCAQSPVSRAGWVGVVLAPLLMLVPGLMRSAEHGTEHRAEHPVEDRTRTCSGLLVALLTVSVYSLVELGVRVVAAPELALDARASMPLGHHNLLALFLLPLLMLALVELVKTRELRTTRAARRLCATSLLAGSAALLATGSLAGLVGFGVGLAVVVLRTAAPGDTEDRFPRSYPWVAGALLLLASVSAAPRVLDLLGGEDSSANARAVYARAAWDGLLERPFFGHGPGSAGWLLPRFVRPELGVNPAGEIVSDPHSFVLLALFETGLVGAALAALLVGTLGVRLLGEPREKATAALAALCAFAVMASASGWFVTPAVWIPLLLVVGTVVEVDRETQRARFARWGWVALCAVLLWSPARAHRAFDRAVSPATPDASALDELRRSVDLDPSFPLYRFWWGRWTDVTPDLDEVLLESQAVFALDRAERLLRQGHESLSSLRSACRTDPLAAWAPLLLSSQESGLRSTLLAARAVALDPRLLAWVELDPRQREAVVRTLERDTRLPSGWRAALVADGRALPAVPSQTPSVTAQLWMDDEGSTSLSLFAFRRRPVPDVLVELTLDQHAVESIRTPPLAAVASEVSPGFLDPDSCSDVDASPGSGTRPQVQQQPAPGP